MTETISYTLYIYHVFLKAGPCVICMPIISAQVYSWRAVYISRPCFKKKIKQQNAAKQSKSSFLEVF